MGTLRIADRTKGEETSALAELREHAAVRFRVALDGAEAASWTRAVFEARAKWIADFGGEQHALGRAFYTHFETGRSAEYFAGAAAANTSVEAVLPGFAGRMRSLLADLVGGRVVQRHGWCGAGVHVFPVGEKVAARGGVIHYDVEGLAQEHLRARRAAVTLVLMLQTPVRGGGLRLYDALYAGEEHASREDRKAAHVTLTYDAGDAVLLDAYRLHRIDPFAGARDRVSATLHAAETSAGVWESWF